MSAAEHETAAAEHETAAAAAPDRPREAPSPKPVVVGYDGSPASSAAVDWAAAAAARRHTTLQVLTAVDYSSVPVWPGASTEYLRDVAMDQARSVADEGVSRALSVGAGVQASSVPAAGGAAGALVEASRAASLLVLGRAEHGAFTSALLGARSLTVIAHARCPVMLVPTGPVLPPGPGHPVVVGVDGSPAAASALAFAADVAAGWGAPLTVMSVWQVPSSETWARAYWDAAPQDSGLHNAKRQRAEQVVQEAVTPVQRGAPRRGRHRPGGRGPGGSGAGRRLGRRGRRGRRLTRSRWLHRHAAGLGQPRRPARGAWPGRRDPAQALTRTSRATTS